MTLWIPSPSAVQNQGPVICGLCVSLLFLQYSHSGEGSHFLEDEVRHEGRLTVEMFSCLLGFCAEDLVFPSLKNSKNVTGSRHVIGGRTD